MSDPNVENAMKIADKILKAILAKFPKYEGFVRRYATDDGNGYIELMIRPENGGRAQEITAAYADEYFLSITAENRNEKATRIFKDFKVLVGAR